MSGLTSQLPVQGFGGENRFATDDDLPDNVSPDALNCDYRQHALEKRSGFVKLHNTAALEGGVRVDNASTARSIWIPHHADYNFAGAFTIELLVRVFSFSTAFRVVFKLPSSGSVTSGWTLNGSGGNFTFTMVDGGAVARTAAAAAYTTGRWHHVAIRRDGSNNLTMYLDGVSAGAAVTCAGNTNTTTPIWFNALGGSVPTAVSAEVLYDELRIWNVYRTDDELAAARHRELRDDEIANPNLIGYWPMQDNFGNMVTDRSKNLNHGTFYAAGPTFVRGVVPDQSSNGWAVRFDGVDDYGSAPYHADYAPVLNTGSAWSVEAWLRLDTLNYNVSVGNPCILHLGSWNTGNGAVVGLHLSQSSADGSLLVSYSTTTTHANVTADTGYDLVPGVPAHIAVTRSGTTVRVYVNGELVYTSTAATSENGPTSSTSYGMFLGGRNSSGSWTAGLFAPVTIDSLRLWKVAISQQFIQLWMNRTLPDAKNLSLLGEWRFDQSDKERDESNRSAFVFLADGNKPRWSYGYAYPVVPKRVQLLAPLITPSTGNEVNAGATAFDREVLVGTRSSLWSLSGGLMNALRQYTNYGEATLSDYCHFQDWLIICNGIDSNYKYVGRELPQSVTLAQPSAAASVALGGAGAITGTVKYRVAFRNSLDGTESLASVESGSVSPAAQIVNLSSIPVSVDPQVNQRRIYRSDNGGLYRYLGDVNDNTTTTYADNTAINLATALVNDFRGDVEPCRYCAVFGNRLWFANSKSEPSGLYFSESDSLDFPATNLLYVNSGDGDEITGIEEAFGGLLVFKRKSVHFLSGADSSSFQTRPVSGNKGCISGQTIRKSPRGIYYLSHDGVYRLEGDGAPVYLSESQYPLFEQMDADNYRFSVGEYAPARHTYLVSCDIATKTGGDYYDVHPGLFTHYWRLNGNGNDASGIANVVAVNSPTFVTDSVRGVVANLGSTNYFECANAGANLPTTGFSVGGWFSWNGYTFIAQQILKLMDQASAMQLQLTMSPTFRSLGFTANTSLACGTGNYVVKPNQWFHVVGTYGANGAAIYVNGVLHSRRSSGSFVALSGDMKLSIGELGGAGNFNGKLANLFYARNRELLPHEVSAIYEYEVGNSYAQRSRITLAYDEDRNTWAKWDRGFDYFAQAQHSSNGVELLGASRGFVYRLFDGYGDGYSETAGSFITKRGAVTGFSGGVLTDATATFPTEGNGLCGTDILFVDSASGARQRRLIIGNTGTVL